MKSMGANIDCLCGSWVFIIILYFEKTSKDKFSFLVDPSTFILYFEKTSKDKFSF